MLFKQQWSGKKKFNAVFFFFEAGNDAQVVRTTHELAGLFLPTHHGITFPQVPYNRTISLKAFSGPSFCAMNVNSCHFLCVCLPMFGVLRPSSVHCWCLTICLLHLIHAATLRKGIDPRLFNTLPSNCSIGAGLKWGGEAGAIHFLKLGQILGSICQSYT